MELSRIDDLAYIQQVVHQTAKDHGWWDNKSLSDIPEKLMLIVSEVSEALEEYRDGHTPNEVYYNGDSKKPEGFGVELADVTIRILDLCGFLEIDLAELISLKHNYNLGRSFMHGNKKI